MSAFVLQLKGDKSFSLFSQVTDAESLSQTWKLCTKVASHLDQGERLENLSWRLFYLHSVMSNESVYGNQQTFKRLSTETGQKLDQEMPLRLPQLETSLCRHNHWVHSATSSTSTRSASIQHPTVMRTPVPLIQVQKDNPLTTCTPSSRSSQAASGDDPSLKTGCVNFESFLSSFSPMALLSAINYLSQGNDLQVATNDDLNRALPTNFELDLDSSECVSGEVRPSTLDEPAPVPVSCHSESREPESFPLLLPGAQADMQPQKDMVPSLSNEISHTSWQQTANRDTISPLGDEYSEPQTAKSLSLETSLLALQRPLHLTDNLMSIPQSSDSFMNVNPQANPTMINTKSTEKRKRRNPMATRPPIFAGRTECSDRFSTDDQQPVCSNCFGTQTPLWRRGPNDELLCNACGVFYKVHKRNRPDTLSKYRYLGGGTSSVNGRELNHKNLPIACTNCEARATPMWRKAPNGDLLCNACALYFKCHKRPRPVTSLLSTSSVTPPIYKPDIYYFPNPDGIQLNNHQTPLELENTMMSYYETGGDSSNGNHEPMTCFSGFSNGPQILKRGGMTTSSTCNEISRFGVFQPFESLSCTTIHRPD